MGQLIKLQDYVSRYEQDIYRYPTQFVRLKKQQWEKLHAAFLAGELHEIFQYEENEEWVVEAPSFFEKMKKMLKKNDQHEEYEEVNEEETKTQEDAFQVRIPFAPKNVEDLKVSFLNQLFHFQMKWATSTIREKSRVEAKYYLDEKLKFFLQRFPDTFLVLYQPVFQLKKAPVETETIILTPTATWCITFLEDEQDSVYIGSNEKFWVKKHHQKQEKKILNPSIGLQRTEWIIKKIYSLYDVDLPIKKAIISRDGYIDYPSSPYDLHLLDKKSFPEWFQSMRKLSSPLKSQQIKGAEALLDYCQTTSIMRLEWDDEVDYSNESNEG